MGTLTWLHISDWHQEISAVDRQVVVASLLEDLGEQLKVVHKIDFIVFSGDVAYRGWESEYDDAWKTLLEHLIKKIGITPAQILAVPGNHDTDRDVVERLRGENFHNLTSEQLQGALADASKSSLMKSPLASYINFCAKYGITDLRSPIFFGEDREVAFIGLDSSLLCGYQVGSDYGNLWVGEHILFKHLNEAAAARVKICVMHHPLNWLTHHPGKKPERGRIGELIRKNFQFFLHGHEHVSGVTLQSYLSSQCVYVASGALYDRRDYPNGYNICTLDTISGNFTILLRRYDGDKNQWGPDFGGAGKDSGVLTGDVSIKQKQVKETPGGRKSIDIFSPSQAISMPSDILGVSSGYLCCWVEVGQHLLNLTNNRYVFAYGDPFPPYKNVFSLSYGPCEYNPPKEPRWKVWLQNSVGSSIVNIDKSLSDGWHHFALCWTDVELRLLIDGDSSEDWRIATPRVHWPTVAFSESLLVGCWPSLEEKHVLCANVAVLRHSPSSSPRLLVEQIYDTEKRDWANNDL